jgi:hypothetical protein
MRKTTKTRMRKTKTRKRQDQMRRKTTKTRRRRLHSLPTMGTKRLPQWSMFPLRAVLSSLRRLWRE